MGLPELSPNHSSAASLETARLMHEAIQGLRRGQLLQAEKLAIKITEREQYDYDLLARAYFIITTTRQRRGDLAGAANAYGRFLSTCGFPYLRSRTAQENGTVGSSDSLAKCIQAPSEQLSKENLRNLSIVDDECYVESSDHFVVRANNVELAKLLCIQGEAALDRIQSLLLGDQKYSHTIEIIVWVDHAEFLANADDAPEWSGGAFRFSVTDAGTVRQIDLTQLDENGQFATVMLDRVLPHELGHLVLREYFVEVPPPMVLDEGVAMLSEWQTDNNRVLLAGTALASQSMIPLAKLLVCKRKDISDPVLFYAEAFSFIEFLHATLNDQQFGAMLGHIKNGISIPEAIQRVLYLPQQEGFLSTLSSAWQEYAISQSQFLRELLRKDDSTKNTESP